MTYCTKYQASSIFIALAIQNLWLYGEDFVLKQRMGNCFATIVQVQFGSVGYLIASSPYKACLAVKCMFNHTFTNYLGQEIQLKVFYTSVLALSVQAQSESTTSSASFSDVRVNGLQFMYKYSGTLEFVVNWFQEVQQVLKMTSVKQAT